MYGWINAAFERLFVDKFGLEAWHAIKEKAKISISDDRFFHTVYYTDDSSYAIVGAASEYLKLSASEILRLFGQYFVHYLATHKLDHVLISTKSWRSWLRDIHEVHWSITTKFPIGSLPELWTVSNEKDPTNDSVILYYRSRRRGGLGDVVCGVCIEIAKFYFNRDITMELIDSQQFEEVFQCSWVIRNVGQDDSSEAELDEIATARKSIGSQSKQPSICPFSILATEEGVKTEQSARFAHVVSSPSSNDATDNDETPVHMPAKVLKKAFPFHFVINQELKVIQAGNKIQQIALQGGSIIGKSLLSFCRAMIPTCVNFSWDNLLTMQDLNVKLELTLEDGSPIYLRGELMLIEEEYLSPSIIFLVSLDCKRRDDLEKHNFGLLDLPRHSFQRDHIVAGESKYQFPASRL